MIRRALHRGAAGRMAAAGAGLVRDTRQGRERVWELAPKRLETARRCLDQISEQWDAAIVRLKDLVEREP